METANELRNAIKNINFYTNKIYQLAMKQIESDTKQFENFKYQDDNAVKIRFSCLGAMGTASLEINLWCKNIEANIKSAEEQDNRMLSNEENVQQEISQQEKLEDLI